MPVITFEFHGRLEKKIAGVYFQQAHYAYRLWGAEAKVRQLESLYPRFFAKPPVPAPPTASLTTVTEGNADLAAVVSAAQAIAGEVDLPHLLEKLLQLCLAHNSGRVMVLLPQGDDWYIEADSDTTEMLQSRAPDNLPTAAVQQVARSRQPLVRPEDWRPFGHPGGLCFPLPVRDEVVGMLYFDAASADLREMLRLLAPQMAVSLRNARTFHQATATKAHNLALSTAYERFVPAGLLQLIGQTDLSRIQPGDHWTVEVAVMAPSPLWKRGGRADIETILSQYQAFPYQWIDGTIVFLAPSATAAVQAAQRITARNQVVIGIHAGSAEIGFMGEPDSLQVVMVGDLVETAVAVQRAAEQAGKAVGVSEAVWEAIGKQFAEDSFVIAQHIKEAVSVR